jgi:predicted porin
LESTYNLNGASKGMTTGLNGGSEFRLGGSEDLGNGMKADFSWAFLNNHNDSPVFAPTAAAKNSISSYQSFVGLSGDFGSVKLGLNGPH